MKISFKQFLNLDKEEQVRLGTFNEDLSGQVKTQKLKELQNLLKNKDWYAHYSDDQRVWKQSQKEDEKIRVLRDLIGDDGHELFKQYAKKAGVFESLKKQTQKDTRLIEKINEVKEKHSIFPEMNKVYKTISMDYGEGKALENKHHFDDGDIYANTPKWVAPTKERGRKYI